MQLTSKQLAEKNRTLIKNFPSFQRDGYLLRRKKSGAKCAHIWRNGDTICRMVSTGGLNLRGYVVAHMTDLPICENCEKIERSGFSASHHPDEGEDFNELGLNDQFRAIMGTKK